MKSRIFEVCKRAAIWYSVVTTERENVLWPERRPAESAESSVYKARRFFFCGSACIKILLGQAPVKRRPVSAKWKGVTVSKWIYDFDDNELLHTLDDGTAIDKDGNVHMRVSEDLSVDLETNELHYTPGWEADTDSDE